jgi:hypothetical protein
MQQGFVGLWIHSVQRLFDATAARTRSSRLMQQTGAEVWRQQDQLSLRLMQQGCVGLWIHSEQLF